MLKVATHNGTFHADDVFAFAILRAASAGHIELVRSRDQQALDAAEVVFDVGGTYDPVNRRYDHHMRDKPLRPNAEPYSSAGLVWRDFGEAAIAHLLPGISPQAVLRVLEMVDCGLVRDVDLMDNGAMTPTPGHFSTVIEAFNSTFSEIGRDETATFMQAADMASSVLQRTCARAWASVQAEATVAEAARNSSDPRILVLDSRVPWEDAVYDLGLDQTLYVVRPAGAAWTCSAVPPERGSFAQRHPLPEAWGGLRDEAIAALTGVPDATFCHPARFVCGARSKDGAVALARIAASTPT
ncbi:MYG1 protein [Paramagnetospirillum magnetotacticum MS-1]|uniref:MYG1 protein n=1 Tax=Paramagnetospirillum magnetotacticum MS-1 TaxID=272627 RepID=A0A0C2UXT1_PARME|nr:MYG1 family protein [Paramagnetospirillum magnetotacticum]KIL97601.1 MYG1 protein [Paramagnetospirillum magnetotacticum MS-1]